MATSKAKPKETTKPAAKTPAKKAKGAAKTAAKPSAKAASKATSKPADKSRSAARTAAKATDKPAKSTAKTAAKGTGKSTTKASTKPARKEPAKPAAKTPRANAKPVAAQGHDLPHIDDKTLSQIIEKLLEMREESQNIVNQHVQTDLKPREESSDVGDDLDQASNERDREFNLIMHQRHLRRLQQIEEAFERIDDGTYGLCEGTDEPINPRRLLIMPLARYSLEYQEQQEKMLGRTMESEGYSESDDSFASDD